MRHDPPAMNRVLDLLRAEEHEHLHPHAAPDARPAATPFVTISRQAGAGGRTFAQQLAEYLNAHDANAPMRWTVWDNELVERVAVESHLSKSRVSAAVDDRPPTWLEEALGSLAISTGGLDDHGIYKRVATTIRALAALGRVIIVGRGAAFATAGMPGGTHLRLVAPLATRVANTVESTGLSRALAADWVKDRDAARAAFYRRHWPTHSLDPENFTVTLNTAATSTDRLVDCIASLIAVPTPAGSTAS